MILKQSQQYHTIRQKLREVEIVQSRNLNFAIVECMAYECEV